MNETERITIERRSAKLQDSQRTDPHSERIYFRRVSKFQTKTKSVVKVLKMRDIVTKVSVNRPVDRKPPTPYIPTCELVAAAPTKTNHADQDQESTSITSQDNRRPTLNTNGKSDIPSYQSFQKYLDSYTGLKFKPVKPGKVVETSQQEPEQTSTHVVDGEGKPHAGITVNKDDARTHKAEIMIQIKSNQEYQQQVPKHENEQPREVAVFDKQALSVTEVGAPPPPPPPMAHVFPAKSAQIKSVVSHNTRVVKNGGVQRVQPTNKLQSCVMDELKAKHQPKEYKEVTRGTYPRRTSEPINMQHVHTLPRFNPDKTNQLKQPVSPQFKKAPGANQALIFGSLPRRLSEQHTIPIMLANPEAQVVTRVPAARPDAPVDRDDPSVKKLVYATLRNYVGAYNNRANLLAAQHDGHVIQDKGVTEQIKSIT